MAYPNETPQDSSSTADQAKQSTAFAADQAKNVAGQATDRAKDVAGTAKSEALDVKDTAVSVGSDVVESAKAQASTVIDEAKGRGQQLLSDGLSEVRSQAANGQSRIAEFVREIADELQSIANGEGTSGPVNQLVGNAQGYGAKAADWLESKSPDDLMADVRRYAARSPWAFLAISAGVGLVGSRLVRGIQGAAADEKNAASYAPRSVTTPVAYGEHSYPTDYNQTQGSTPAAGYAETGYAQPLDPYAGSTDPVTGTVGNPLSHDGFGDDHR